MKTILITGPIGSGKSEVRRILAARGFPVYDCDSRCKALYESVPGLKKRIEEALGVPFGGISVIFRDDSLREKLESIVYPELISDFRKWREGLSGPVCFVESAIAASKPVFDGLYDAIWLVDAPYEVRVKRNPKAEQRSSLQSFEGLAPELVINNDSTIENLEKQIP